MSSQVPPGPGQPPQGSEPPYEPYSSQAPGVPPPPASYPSGGPQGTPPQPYGQPTYGSVPSYGPAPQYGQQPYGPPSEPSYGPPSGQEQPSYGGYDPAQAGYGAPGYQPGQGQGLPPGGYVPSYGGPQPGAPKGGSAAKIVAIAAGAVVFVGLVAGGVYLLTRDGGDPVADKTTSSSPKASKTSATPKPTTSSPTPTPTSTTEDMSWDEATALAEAAFPAAAGYEYATCMPWSAEYDADLMVTCRNDVDSDIWFDVLVYSDTSSATAALRDDWMDFQESSWERGTDFVSASSGSYYYVVRCYSDAPVCVEVAASGGKAAAETALSHISYLDAAGIAALNDRLAGGV